MIYVNQVSGSYEVPTDWTITLIFNVGYFKGAIQLLVKATNFVDEDKEKIDNVLPVVIRVDTSFKNSIFDGILLFELSKKSAAKEDIDQFTKEILGINAWSASRKNGAPLSGASYGSE